MGQGIACKMCGGVHHSQKWMQICAHLNGGDGETAVRKRGETMRAMPDVDANDRLN